MFGDLRFVPNDPTTIGACFAAQTEELITAILDRSISLLLCLLLRALFFCIKTAKTVLQKPFFSSVLFKRNFFEKMDRFVCSRPPKKKNFRLQICPRGLPSSSRQPRIQNQRKLVRVCGIKFQFSLPLCIKLKLFSKE